MPLQFRFVAQKSLAVFLLLSAALLFEGCNRNGNLTGHANANRETNDRAIHELVDLNSASKTQLIQLPGIGEVHAQQIIDGRPYREKTDLVRRNIIPQKTYDLIADKVIAKQH